MATYVQAERFVSVTTPLGKDKLLMVGLSGHEAVSRLFRFQIQALAENDTEVGFDKLLGQKIAVTLPLPDGKKRHFNGICSRAAQGEQDAVFTSYWLEIVPQFWLLTRRAQSRIFQHVTVPDILKKVLEGLDVSYEIQGTFPQRDYCVQYRETDFNFASRLMEEEGIYYFFKHTADGHKMVVANSPQSHPDLPEWSKLIFEKAFGGNREEERITEWEKVQELRSGKVTLWDHCFEIPHKHLESDKTITDSIQVGKVSHKQKVGGNDKLELYEYPGEYAQRFDGVDRGGGDQPGELQKIFEDNKRTAEIRMQQEAVQGLVIRGISGCQHMSSGYKFTLDRHFNANGAYLLTSVEHNASVSGDYRSGEGLDFSYHNRFTCIPFAQPFRPTRTTPRPFVQGTQTAVVVGPAGEEIFTDKYSRVKVQFHWDREGKNDAGSSCWVRVATLWGGKQWGFIHIPRIGQEVIVAFEEGDPDRPIIVGSVFNAEMMPPYALPDNKTQSGFKTRSSMKGTPDNFNEIRLEDKKGEEQVYIHAEKNEDIVVENDKTETVGHDETIHILNDRTETVDGNESLTVHKNRTRMVTLNELVTVLLTRTHTVGVNELIAIGAAQQLVIGLNQTVAIGNSQSLTVGKDQTNSVSKDRSTEIGKNDVLKVGKEYTLEAGEQIVLKTGKSSITMKKDGTIVIAGKDITIQGSGKIVGKASGNMILKGSNIKEN